MMKKTGFILVVLVNMIFSGACSPTQTNPTPQSNLPNPASVYCEQHGNKLQIVTDTDGSQRGVCVFPDGSTCDEWAYFHGECTPSKPGEPTPSPIMTISTEIPTTFPIDPADYQGWWMYTQPVYHFSILLPENWLADEASANNPLLNGHMIQVHPKQSVEKETIRMTFRRVGEETLLWPTGVGQGDFVPQGTLDIGGQPAQRVLLVCPSGETDSIWYHQTEKTPNVRRGDLEFGLIFNASSSHCQAGYSLSGKIQRTGEMIIASLKVP